MTNRIPVKAIYSGSNVTALGEFVSNDIISTDYTEAKITSVAGQTGAISNAQLLAGVQGTGIFTTANVAELSNLYFSNARVYSNVLQLNYATVSYVDQAVANVIDAAPGVLDTLNEIAAAINDDPSFFANVALAGGIAYDQANAAYNRANLAVLNAGAAFDKANALVTLGADTTGDYVQNVIPGAGIVISGAPGESRDATIALNSSGVTANTYGGSSNVPVLTIDQYGRITSAANVSVAGVSAFSSSGNSFTITTADGGSFSASLQENSVRLGTDTTGDYVKNVIPSTGITITGTTGESREVTIALENTVVTPNTYGGSTEIPVFVVDQQGRITSASNVSLQTSVGYPNSTTTLIPTGDLGSGETYVGQNLSIDAFSVSIVTTYDCMDPLGSIAALDLN